MNIYKSILVSTNTREPSKFVSYVKLILTGAVSKRSVLTRVY